MRKLLCITAHPDDEAGAFGGALALYHQQGVETSVICLTAGTAARNRGTSSSDEELASLRRNEFATSCRLLGVSHYEVLYYPDGKLDRANFYAVTGDLVRKVRQQQPQVVLTFGMDGGLTGHPDHAMAGMFATMAFQWAGRADRYPEQLEEGLQTHRAQKLYWAAADYLLPNAPQIAPVTVTARLQLSEELMRKKIEAFRQHTTQAPLFERLKQNVSRAGTAEMYHLVGTESPREAKFETDLFEGVLEG